jgi:beta-lactam-binding protein with PASTA domain
LLAVAAPVRVEPTVEVPSLTGLSQEEAKKALEALGLKLGKVEERRRRIA